MGMVVVIFAMLVGLGAAVVAQVAVYFFNIRNETAFVLGVFSLVMMLSAPLIATLLGV